MQLSSFGRGSEAKYFICSWSSKEVCTPYIGTQRKYTYTEDELSINFQKPLPQRFNL